MSVPNRRAGFGNVITALVVVGGAIAVGVAFVSNASPYGDFKDAKETKSESIHVAGTIERDTIQTDLKHGNIRFTMKDEKGMTVPVVYTGDPPANLTEATKVVAIGGMEGNEFHSTKLLIKCPSKYQAQTEQPS